MEALGDRNGSWCLQSDDSSESKLFPLRGTGFDGRERNSSLRSFIEWSKVSPFRKVRQREQAKGTSDPALNLPSGRYSQESPQLPDQSLMLYVIPVMSYVIPVCFYSTHQLERRNPDLSYSRKRC